MRLFTCVATFIATTVVALAAEPARGTTATEIVIGTITDPSGVTAVQGVNNSAAIRMVFDDANAKGDIHGRKIKYISRTASIQCRAPYKR
jgi:branched-chain amino acid transport system substrate-binding protein